MEPRAFLTELFHAAIDAARPSVVVPQALHQLDIPMGRTVVVGAGKASAAMAQALEQNWSGDLAKLEGLVVTRYGHSVPCEHIEVVEAAHPVPDEASRVVAGRMLEKVAHLSADDIVIALISGGGSSLLVSPAEGLSLADKQEINRQLLGSGATIQEMNTVRKHLSKVKGGRLALAAYPARVVSLLISDIPGDDLSMVASGPTMPDSTTCEEALEIVNRYQISIPDWIRKGLENGDLETPKSSDPAFAHAEAHLLASSMTSLRAAARVAQEHGVEAIVLSDSIQGEARDLGFEHAALALQKAKEGARCVVLSGGETTVTVRGTGRGGRNVEYLTALAIGLKGHPDISAIAGDTDGVDGTDPVAGAYVDSTTELRAQQAGWTLQNALDQNDSHRLFEALQDQVITGPTLTNVNDFRAILIGSLK